MGISSEKVVHGLVVASWLALPFTLGTSLEDALTASGFDEPVVLGVLAWAVWGVMLLGLLVPRTLTLTVARFAVPAGVPVALWSLAASDGANVEGVAGLTLAVCAGALVLTAPFGWQFANGSAYGAERRYPLRPPMGLVLGPLPLSWVVAVAGVTMGPVLAADGLWLIGAVATAIGWPVAFVVVRAAHLLARRWMVLVPAGLVVHDPMAMADSLLAMRTKVTSIGPAPADTDATDLTMGATGLALQITLTEPHTILTQADRRAAEGSLGATRDVTAVLIMPSRPGAALHAAGEARMPVG